MPTESDSNALAKVLSTDTKMSKSELIELIIEEMSSEIEVELAQVNERLEELENKTFAAADVEHLLKRARFRIRVDTWNMRNRNGAPDASLQFSTRDGDGDELEVSPSDRIFGKHIGECVELSQRRDELQRQKSRFETQKKQVKATIMKRVLEGTAEGRNVLEQIQNLKVNLRKQLNAKK